MKTRAITGFFFVIAMLGSLLLGAEVFAIFYLLLASACLFEFYGMFSAAEIQPRRTLGLFLGFLSFTLLVLADFGLVPTTSLAFILLLLPILMISQLYRLEAKPFERIAATLLGIFYVILPFYCFYQLGFVSDRYQFQLPLGFFLMLWANDTGAYLIGRAFGRTKLLERISPGKTWEGFVGGLVSAILVGFILHQYTVGILLQWQWITVAVLISTFGTLGDLTESMLKRSLGVKDSGKLLPGHGGLLDRFDGLLIAAPVVYVFLAVVS